ncbi:hypothetical protein Clacol_000731 [Clathrus columnatus]|uniref:MIOS-like alpha-solenoid domain-containing protein n=1 Tax=Clathrus columnatus TaxID=1419009 RepID=A0AAV4ZX33_9AGAM|nr:hypothetical protein Clacol_000731 [Clathrus columnatus]
MVQSDKRIVWHPTKPRRFVIGGVGGAGGGGTSVGQIKVYDWDGRSEIAEVTTLGDLVHMKCFALSPHPLDTDLIAVGTTLGKVELLRFSITHPPNTLRSPSVTSLPVRTSRACNTLVFSSRDPNYLAVGLDKVRGEPSLVIWDVESASSKVFNVKTGDGGVRGGENTSAQVQSVPNSFSATFGSTSTSTSTPYTRLDPLLPSNTPRNDKYMIQHWLHTETVTSLSFMPHTTDLLIAGVSHRGIRLFDLRSPSGVVGSAGSNPNASTTGSGSPTSPSNPQSIPTKAVHGLCYDPFDYHQFASFGEDGFVRIWDYRYFTSPVLSFSERDALSDGAEMSPAVNSIAAIEYSKTRRGSILTLERDAHVVRVWDTIRATVEEQVWDHAGQINIRNQGHQAGQGDGTSKISRLARLPWSTTPPSSTNLSTTVVEPYPNRSPLVGGIKPSIKTEYVVLRNTRTSSRLLRPLASFTSIPYSTHWGWGIDPDSKSAVHVQAMPMSIAVLTKDGELDMQTLYDAPIPQWNALGELSVSAGRGCRVYQPRDEKDVEDMSGSFSGLSVKGKERKMQDTVSSALAHTHPSRPTSFIRFPLTPTGTDIHQTPRPGALNLAIIDTGHTETRGRTTVAVDTHSTQVPIHGLSSAPASRSRRSISKGKLSAGERSSRRAVMDDISMIMKRRAARGYGVDNPFFNATIVKADAFHSDTLYELWTWIDSSRTLLSRHPRIYGFDFSNQGIYGIWEGFPMDAKAKHHYRERGKDKRGDHESLSFDVVFGTRNLELSPAPSHTYTLTPDKEGGGHTGSHSRSRKSTSSTTASIQRSHSPSGDYTAAVQVLSEYHSRSMKDKEKAGIDHKEGSSSNPVQSNPAFSNVRIAAPTSKPAQRRLCLLLCGWCLSDEELLSACIQWEQEGQLTRAACWLLFINHQDRAIECLMRSDDERLRIMSGTVAALLAQRGTSNQVREHYNRLIVRIEDPYIRVMLTHVALDDWSDILQEEYLPLRERLAIALRFLDDRSLSSYLRQLTESFRQQGDIEGVILTGLTPLGFEVIQGYVDTTGDVQTASILASLVLAPSVSKTIPRWIEAYRTLLDTWRMFHVRCQFDIARGKIIREGLGRAKEDAIPHSHPHVSPGTGQNSTKIHPRLNWTRPQFVIRCPFCKKNVNLGLGSSGSRFGGGGKLRTTSCQSCDRSLPRCSICLVVLELAYDLEHDMEMTDGGVKKGL